MTISYSAAVRCDGEVAIGTKPEGCKEWSINNNDRDGDSKTLGTAAWIVASRAGWKRMHSDKGGNQWHLCPICAEKYRG